MGVKFQSLGAEQLKAPSEVSEEEGVKSWVGDEERSERGGI